MARPTTDMMASRIADSLEVAKHPDFWAECFCAALDERADFATAYELADQADADGPPADDTSDEHAAAMSRARAPHAHAHTHERGPGHVERLLANGLGAGIEISDEIRARIRRSVREYAAKHR